MGRILGSDWGLDPTIIHWCTDCYLDHYVDGKYWIWNGTKYNEEQFEKVLQLKAFW